MDLHTDLPSLTDNHTRYPPPISQMPASMKTKIVLNISIYSFFYYWVTNIV
nr:MAG TPA: hypothetical protein [Caudoviricetes sp.]DAQ99338.1 MAG TPA: hypothetical protein [Caudoviricetes sp.]